ncbi:hypothetical protein LJB71_12680 [Thermomonas sp. S9]|uniref:hypothetical protein n=1 Tax=Thermomonas sp. S9 TaxID=2885203 RepID=UPI00216B22ED|nr:hypothetical protein [Thermomonas sp. S9]MCR6496988.1 hypothetical protein [Thermomonas sp. S9]
MEPLMDARVVSDICGTLLFSVVACAAAESSVGTYSTLAYNEESGDLNGLEITIIPVDGGLVASVQIAEDGINELHLAKVKESAGVLLFSPRLNDGSTINFSMKCSPKSCLGEYVWGQANVKFVLPKSNGYWNKRSLNNSPAVGENSAMAIEMRIDASDIR